MRSHRLVVVFGWLVLLNWFPFVPSQLMFTQLMCPQLAFAQEASTTATAKKVPFGFADFGWMNGQSRLQNSVLSNEFLTVSLYLDASYNYSFNRPLDNTIVGSYTVGRHNEFGVNLMTIGLETNYKNIIGRVQFQTGNSLAIIQDLDPTVQRGRNLSSGNLKFIREAAVGYHFDVDYGLNVEMGMFMSYIGLESYLTGENWNFQRAMTSDFTPFYFTGARAQYFPTETIKIEPWLMNGWQSYGTWNSALSFGVSNYWRPTGALAFAANFYYGTDVRNNPDAVRFNHDHSVVMKYFDAPDALGISKMAFSINNHIGFETDGGRTASGNPAKNQLNNQFFGTSICNRIWFARNALALTLRYNWIQNPGRYIAPAPTAAGFVDGGTNLQISTYTATLDVMPNDHLTLRLEFFHGDSDVPFYAGRGGTTSPDGWQGTPTTNWTPDVVSSENRFMVAANFRL